MRHGSGFSSLQKSFKGNHNKNNLPYRNLLLLQKQRCVTPVSIDESMYSSGYLASHCRHYREFHTKIPLQLHTTAVIFSSFSKKERYVPLSLKSRTQLLQSWYCPKTAIPARHNSKQSHKATFVLFSCWDSNSISHHKQQRFLKAWPEG